MSVCLAVSGCLIMSQTMATKHSWCKELPPMDVNSICLPVKNEYATQFSEPTSSTWWRNARTSEKGVNAFSCRRVAIEAGPLGFFVCHSGGGVLNSCSSLWNEIPSLPRVLPLWYNLVGIGEVAVDVLHLERVSVADLVIGPAVVSCLDHDDVTPRATEINGISLARELSPDQAEGQRCTAEACRGTQKKLSGKRKKNGKTLQDNKTTHHGTK